MTALFKPAEHGKDRETHRWEVTHALHARWIERILAGLTQDDVFAIEKEATMLMHERGFPGLTIRLNREKRPTSFILEIQP